MATREELQDEQIRVMRLRARVDLTCWRLRRAGLSREQGLELIARTREEILDLFPGKSEVFDLVLRPRFLRMLDEREWIKWGVADSIN